MRINGHFIIAEGSLPRNEFVITFEDATRGNKSNLLNCLESISYDYARTWGLDSDDLSVYLDYEVWEDENGDYIFDGYSLEKV